MNLRERQKLETRALIQRAALELAVSRGAENVTNEAICDAAGISIRTFHNYFPFKEAVFVVAPDPLPPEAVVKFLAAPGDVMSDLGDLMAAHAALLQHSPWLGPLMRDLLFSHPRLLPLQRAEFLKFDRHLQDVLAIRLGREKDDPTCAVLAGAVLGANRRTIERWFQSPDFDLPAAVRDGLKALAGIIRESGHRAAGTREGIPAD